ncbi:MAG: hypothetical protein WC924_01245 [Candidatus Gracilibacteria bacterium]
MGTTASDVIALAQNTKALSKEQLARILEVAPKMTETDLENLKKMILAVQEAEIKSMKNELEVRKKVGAHFLEWKTDKTRDALQIQEGATRREDSAQAESLIQNI